MSVFVYNMCDCKFRDRHNDDLCNPIMYHDLHNYLDAVLLHIVPKEWDLSRLTLLYKNINLTTLIVDILFKHVL